MVRINLLTAPVIMPLTRGKFTIIDRIDYDRVSKFRLHANLDSSGKYYAKTCAQKINGIIYPTFTIKSPGKPTTLLGLHRLVMNADNGSLVDHINGNTLDNRRENLRICTKQQNNMNTKRRKDNISGYKGVYFDKQRNKWMAHVSKNGKAVYRKRFMTKEEAARAYEEASKKFHGEYARIS